MATRKGVGGPKTDSGKAKSSLNATKFGVSTFRAIDDEEKQLIAHFTTELLEYYEPESPLEIMQLERIALCRAKLARLYEVERTRLQLAQHNISASPEKLLNQLNIPNGLSKKLALEQIDYGTMTLPLHLIPTQLKSIVEEVQYFSTKTISEKEFKRQMPILYQHLIEHEFFGVDQEVSILMRLQKLLEKLIKILESDNPLVGKIANFLEVMLQKGGEAKQDDQEAHNLLLQINPDYVEPTAESIRMAERIDNAYILENLKQFVELHTAYQQAGKIVKHYEQSKELIVKSLVLPQTEADLLLRYQTTWERRLSTEVGEFIELRKYGR